MANKTITSVLISDVEKRRFPDKHYVYVISVRWSDGTSNIIYRRYSQFFNLQTELIELFPKESGKTDPEDRIIPFLPGKILFGRSNIRDVALKRQPSIDEYCQKLVTLPSRISECDDVIDFFEVTDEDIHPPSASDSRPSAITITDPLQLEHYEAIADYEKVTSQEVSLVAGMAVDVIEKNESGWWLVSVEEEQGWVPSTYLERIDGTEDDNTVHSPPNDETSYICSGDYTAANDDEISLDRGACVEVLRKKLDGWWWVSYKDNAGWAPATYLEKLESNRADHFSETEAPANRGPVQIVRNLFDVTTLSIEVPSGTSDVSAKGDVTAKSDVNEEPAKNDVELRPGKDERVPKHRLSSSSSNPRFSSQPPRRNTISRKVPPKRPDPPKVKKEYYTIADFTHQAEDGLSFVGGQQAKILEKNTSGWWYVEIDGNTGWVPASYIEEKTFPLAKLASTAEETSTDRPRKASRQGLGAPPPPPLPEVKQEVKPDVCKTESNEPKEDNNNQSKMPNLGFNFALPKFGGLKKSEEKKSDEKESGFVPKMFKKKENEKNDLPKSEGESRVANISSALKNVLKPKGAAQKSVQIVDPATSEADYSPCIYAEIPDIIPGNEMYLAIADYENADDTEVGLKEGQLVTVVEKTDTGWWLVQVEESEGWTPASYLEEAGNDLYEEVSIISKDQSVAMATKTTVANGDAVAREESSEGGDLASQLSKVMAARRTVWNEDDVEKVVPTEEYDVTPESRSYSGDSQSRLSTISSDATRNESETVVPTANAFAEARKKLNAVQGTTESKPKFEHKKFDKPKPEMKPVTVTKPTLNPASVKPTLNPASVKPTLNPASVKPTLNPASVKPTLNPASVNKFLDKSGPASSTDAEVSELTKARKRLTSVMPKEDLKTSATNPRGSTTNQSTIAATVASDGGRSCAVKSSGNEMNKARDSILARAKMFSDVTPKNDRPRTPPKSVYDLRRGSASNSPSNSRPSTPPKPISDLRRSSTNSPSNNRPLTPTKPNLAREQVTDLSTAFTALKSQKPNLGAKPTTKPKISDLAARFDKPEVSQKKVEGPVKRDKGTNGAQNDELAAILNKRRTHVDS